MTIAAAVTFIQAGVRALAGMRNAPDNPTDSTAIFPFAISYISECDVEQRTVGNRRHFYTITTEIHVARKDLSRDVSVINVYPALYTDMIWADPTFGGAVSTVDGSVTGSLVPSAWGGVDTLCWMFKTKVKVM